MDVKEYEVIQKNQLLQDIKIFISQLEKGEGIEHSDAELMIMERIGK
jgi:hypothetical protein